MSSGSDFAFASSQHAKIKMPQKTLGYSKDLVASTFIPLR
jgi:hypothetical protein